MPIEIKELIIEATLTEEEPANQQADLKLPQNALNTITAAVVERLQRRSLLLGEAERKSLLRDMQREVQAMLRGGGTF